MIDITTTFSEWLKDIYIVAPTYNTVSSSGVIPAPSTNTTVVKGAFQPRSSSNNATRVSGNYTNEAVLYIDTSSSPTGQYYFTINSSTYIISGQAIDIANMLDCTKISLYKPNYITSTWYYKTQGSAVAGSWVPGANSSVSASYMLWDDKLIPDQYVSKFISNFDYTADMYVCITHPASVVPPVNSTTQLDGNTVEVMYRSPGRHPYALGHILLLKRMV